jgi:hypothetical protein
MRLIPLSVPNVRGKIVPLFLSELPYLVVSLVLQRIQYSAMIVEKRKSKIFQYCVRILKKNQADSIF